MSDETGAPRVGTIARIHVDEGDLQSWPVAEKVTRGWQSGKHFYPDDLVAEVQTVYVRDAEVAELERQIQGWIKSATETNDKLAAAEAVIEKVSAAWFGPGAFDANSEDGSALTVALNEYRGEKP
jgi:hypothetical protein